jgi:hypothetical protein
VCVGNLPAASSISLTLPRHAAMDQCFSGNRSNCAHAVLAPLTVLSRRILTSPLQPEAEHGLGHPSGRCLRGDRRRRACATGKAPSGPLAGLSSLGQEKGETPEAALIASSRKSWRSWCRSCLAPFTRQPQLRGVSSADAAVRISQAAGECSRKARRSPGCVPVGWSTPSPPADERSR